MTVIEAGPGRQLFLIYNSHASATDSKTVLRLWNDSAWRSEIPLSTEGSVAVATYALAVNTKGSVHLAFC